MEYGNFDYSSSAEEGAVSGIEPAIHSVIVCCLILLPCSPCLSYDSFATCTWLHHASNCAVDLSIIASNDILNNRHSSEVLNLGRWWNHDLIDLTAFSRLIN